LCLAQILAKEEEMMQTIKKRTIILTYQLAYWQTEVKQIRKITCYALGIVFLLFVTDHSELADL
jgi:hypothetical protein